MTTQEIFDGCLKAFEKRYPHFPVCVGEECFAYRDAMRSSGFHEADVRGCAPRPQREEVEGYVRPAAKVVKAENKPKKYKNRGKKDRAKNEPKKGKYCDDTLDNIPESQNCDGKDAAKTPSNTVKHRNNNITPRNPKLQIPPCNPGFKFPTFPQYPIRPPTPELHGTRPRLHKTEQAPHKYSFPPCIPEKTCQAGAVAEMHEFRNKKRMVQGDEGDSGL